MNTAYSCRVYKWWLAHLNFYIQKQYSYNMPGMEIPMESDTIRSIYYKEGPVALGNKLNEKQQHYLNSINITTARCLACEKTENLIQCAKCKQAYFCSANCQNQALMFHKYDCE